MTSITVRQRCTTHVEDGCLVIENDDKKLKTTFDDVNMLIVETQEAMLSAAALSAAGEANVPVVFCNRKHMPVSTCTAISGNGGAAGYMRLQIQCTRTLKKQLWKRVVETKIANQASVLKEMGKSEAAQKLERISKRVKSGDSDNREAVAAALYFREYIAEGTRRDSALTASLDYGYAIVRSGMARSLLKAGLHPALGIQHKGNRDGFALADDLMEPFRPFVDRTIRSLGTLDKKPKGIKTSIARVLEEQALVEGLCMTLPDAMDRCAVSMRYALQAHDVGQLVLPTMTC